MAIRDVPEIRDRTLEILETNPLRERDLRRALGNEARERLLRVGKMNFNMFLRAMEYEDKIHLGSDGRYHPGTREQHKQLELGYRG